MLYTYKLTKSLYSVHYMFNIHFFAQLKISNSYNVKRYHRVEGFKDIVLFLFLVNHIYMYRLSYLFVYRKNFNTSLNTTQPFRLCHSYMFECNLHLRLCINTFFLVKENLLNTHMIWYYSYILCFIWLYTLKPFNDDLQSHLLMISDGKNKARVSSRPVVKLNSFGSERTMYLIFIKNHM